MTRQICALSERLLVIQCFN